MSKIRGYLIDVNNGTHGERIIEDELPAYYSTLNCGMIEIMTRRIGAAEGRKYSIVCDEDGLLGDDPICSAVNHAGREMFVESLFVAGLPDAEGNLTSLSDDDIEYISRFVVMETPYYLVSPTPILTEVEY